MTVVKSMAALRSEDERREALRALLREPFIDSTAPIFTLIRRHDAELTRRCADLLGYRLRVTPSFARLTKVPTERMRRRAVHVPPSGATARERSRDDWPKLSDRGVVLLFLTLAALERGGQQTVIGELAGDVITAGARLEPSIAVDFELRAERMAFADGVELLCHWGVLALMHGRRGTFANRVDEQADDQALFTLDRHRLALVLSDAFGALSAQTVSELNAEEEPATTEAQVRRLRHRLARRLVEDPVLYLDELREDERAYFISQRAYLERRVEDWTGLIVERRAEGTAMIEAGRELTDLPFPANSSVKQLALLLCDWLVREEEVSRTAARRAVRGLLAHHERHWNRSPDDEETVTAMLDQAISLLTELDLVEATSDAVRARPLCARFRAAEIREAGAQ